MSLSYLLGKHDEEKRKHLHLYNIVYSHDNFENERKRVRRGGRDGAKFFSKNHKKFCK